MTALTPVEEREVTRFGMFDAEAIGQIDLDDEPPCCVDHCGAAAIVLVITRCCNLPQQTCASHLIWWRNNFAAGRPQVHVCGFCRHTKVGLPTFEQWYRVVDL